MSRELYEIRRTTINGAPYAPDFVLTPESQSIRDSIDSLETAVKTLIGTSNQIIITSTDAGTSLTFTLPQSINTTSDVQFRHIKGSGSAPTVSAEGTGAGTSPQFTITGTDTLFKCNLTVGTSAAGSAANIATFAFAAAYTTAPDVIIIPNNRLTWSTQATVAKACIVGGITTTQFTLQVGSTTALVDSNDYSWYFLVIGN
jgi:hypothetical protein